MTFGAMTQSDGFEVQTQDKGGSWLIAYLDMDESRQFGVFNSLGFEFYQSGGNLKRGYLFAQGRQRVQKARHKRSLVLQRQRF